MSKQKLAEELHRPIIRKFKKEKVRSSFINIIWGADFADIQLISKFNKSIRFLLCFTVIFSKYTWAVTLKGKKVTTVTNAFQKLLDDSNCKAKKIWVDKGNEFYNRSMKPWLQDNIIEMVSTHNVGKSVVAEGFIRTLRNKF